jgi:hypothetical protein
MRVLYNQVSNVIFLKKKKKKKGFEMSSTGILVGNDVHLSKMKLETGFNF